MISLKQQQDLIMRNWRNKLNLILIIICWMLSIALSFVIGVDAAQDENIDKLKDYIDKEINK